MTCYNDKENNGNIYEKLEIKDYVDIFMFLNEVVDRGTLSQLEDAVMIFGDISFIHRCIVQLANIYGYKIGFVQLYGFDDISTEFVLMVKPDYNGNMIMNVEPVRMYGFNRDTIIKDFSSYYKYTRLFINQNNVKQDLIDTCLNKYDEVMLFGICSPHDKNNKDVYCDESCPWFEECV